MTTGIVGPVIAAENTSDFAFTTGNVGLANRCYRLNLLALLLYLYSSLVTIFYHAITRFYNFLI